MDGVDAVVADFAGSRPMVLRSFTLPYPSRLRKALEHIVATGGNTELISRLDFALGQFLAHVALEAVRGVPDVIAIGSHGQTVFHNPEPEGRLPGCTLQIGEPWHIALATGLPVYFDFRRFYVAKGEEGAPLAHILHQRIFSSKGVTLCVLNIGGICNVSVLRNGRAVLSFDTGPGMGLVDEAVKVITNGRYKMDKNARFSKKGNVHEKALAYLLDHPFFCKSPPRSTGKETFGRNLVLSTLKRYPSLKQRPADLVRTTVEAGAVAAARAIKEYSGRNINEVILCGGGRLHPVFVQRFSTLMSPVHVSLCDEKGVDGDSVEGLLIAYLTFLAWKGEYPAKSVFVPVDLPDYVLQRK